jgi:Flp pilus assembly pilin Flp
MNASNNRSISSIVRSFHEDEDGIEAVQVVMIVAIAAIILVAMMTVGNKIYGWMEGKWGELEGTSIG